MKSNFAGIIRSIIDNLYKKFFLRDFLGKIIPGLVLLSTAVFVNDREFKNITIDFHWWVWIGLLGVAWVVGFATQVGRELILYIAIRTRNDRLLETNTIEEWYAKYFKFSNKAKSRYRETLERFIVIGESTGNLGVALIIPSMVGYFTHYIGGSMVLFIFAISICLIQSSIVHRKRRNSYVNTFLNE